MTNLETRIRENLAAAGESLVVPEPRRRETRTTPDLWRRRIGTVAIAALVTLVVVLTPVILLNPTESESGQLSPVGTPIPSTTVRTMPPTTAAPSSTSSTQPEAVSELAEVNADSARYVLLAEKIDQTDQTDPTATITLRVFSDDGLGLIDEIQVGETHAFFWHSVTGVDGVCAFTPSGPETNRVVTQIRLSSSAGCSQPWVFDLRDGSLVEVDASAEDISSLFVTAWESADDDMMLGLGTGDVVESALDITLLSDPTLVSCDGVAGSIYCTYDDADRFIVIRLQNTEQPPTVVEIRVDPEQ